MLQQVGLMSVPKENNLLVKTEIPNHVLSDFNAKFLKRVRFHIKIFTTCRILYEKTFRKSDLEQNCAFKKSRFY